MGSGGYDSFKRVWGDCMNLKLQNKILILLLGVIIFVVWIECEQRFVIKGRVVEASTGKPIEGASVAVSWTGTHLIEMFIPYASGSYTIEEAEATTDKAAIPE